MAVLLVLVGCVIALIALLVIGDRRAGGELRRPRSRHTMDPGTLIHERSTVEIVGTTASGVPTTVSPGSSPSPTLLVFLGSTCVTCRDLWRGASRAVRGAGPLRIVIVTKGSADESAALVAKHAHDPDLVVMSDSAWDAYGVAAAPAFVLVEGHGGAATRLVAAPTWREVLGAARATLTVRGVG